MAARNPDTGLTPRQETFATGVASGLSQADAYRAAYPRSAKWKDETVWARASELAADRMVSGRVALLGAKAAAANEVTVERVVRELAKLAFGDRRALMEWGPSGVVLRDSKALTDDQAAQVAEVSETTTMGGGSIKIKTHDKVRALELLGKSIGMFVDRTELSGPEGKPIGAVIYVPENGRSG